MTGQVLCVIANDTQIRFFTKGIKHWVNNLGEVGDVQYTFLQPTNNSWEICKSKIENVAQEGLIVLFLHGGDGYLMASREGSGTMPGGGILNTTELHLREKHIIIVACNSKNRTIKTAIAQGAKAAIGFGMIDFACLGLYENDTSHEYKFGKRPKKESFAKFLFREIIISSLDYVVKRKYSLEKFVPVFRFYCNRHIDELILDGSIKEQKVTLSKNKKNEVAMFLQRMKEEITLLE